MTGTTGILALNQREDEFARDRLVGRARSAAWIKPSSPRGFPQPGWVEHDPDDLSRSTLDSARGALRNAGVAARISRVAGDQQAARVGQAGFARSLGKNA